MPNPRGSICIDSKFPLESLSALTGAADEVARDAARSLEGDVKKHINDIAQKYIVPGEDGERHSVSAVRVCLC